MVYSYYRRLFRQKINKKSKVMTQVMNHQQQSPLSNQHILFCCLPQNWACDGMEDWWERWLAL